MRYTRTEAIVCDEATRLRLIAQRDAIMAAERERPDTE